MRVIPRWFGLAVLLQLSCSELPSIQPTGCGNRLVEPQSEDCDGVADEPGTRCASPGEAHACRYVCVSSSGDGVACPKGYACGLDNVCRKPSGGFQQAGRSVEVAALDLRVGDFDDNKQKEILALGTSDVLGRVSSQVIFFSDDAERATTQAIPGLLGSPVVGRFADSPYDGIAFHSLPGIAMLIGRRDRQFFPRSYPSFPNPPGIISARLYAQDILPPKTNTQSGELEFLGDEPLLFASSGSEHLILSISGQKEQIIALLPQGPDALLGDVVQGHFHESLSCPTLVVPFQNASELLLVTPCESDGQGGMRWVTPGTPPASFVLPPGLELFSKPIVVDLDQDGHQDLLFGLAEQGSAVTFAAYGDGQGGLHALPGGQGPIGLDFFTLPSAQVRSPCGGEIPPENIDDPGLAAKLKGRAVLPPPMAVADLDGDQQLDWILSYGVCTSRDLINPAGPPLYQLLASPLGGAWGEVLVLDLNADGRPDVLGAPEESRALDLLLGSPQGLFNAATLPLNGSPSLLNPGDFDGDGSPDVVFRERGVQGTSNVGAATGDAVTVLFSAPKQIPSSLARVGRFDRVEHLTSGSTPELLAVDGISDIGVISRAAPPKDALDTVVPPSVSLFFGSPDRALRSPLTLGASDSPEQDVALPILTTSGRFTEHNSAAQQDLIAVGLGDAPSSALSCQEGEVRTGRGLRFWLVALTGDAQLRGIFSSEVLDLGGTGGVDLDCPERGQFTAGDLDGDGFDEAIFALPSGSGSRVLVGRTRGQASAPEVLPPRDLAVKLASGAHPLVADADGDGKKDALFLTLSESGTQTLSVLWGKGDGSFEETPSTLQLQEQNIQGICGVRGDGQGSVLLLGEQGLFRLDSSRTLAAISVNQFTSEQRGGVALACGDLDGDGVDDVAISSGSLLRVFRGLPVRP